MFLDQDFTERDIFNIEQKQRANTISEEIVLKAKPGKRWQWATGAFGFYQWLHTTGPVLFKEEGVKSVIENNANAAFDIYGEYFYTRENGDSAVLSSGETYDFDSIASNRVRIGTRYTRQYGSEHELYAGAAYEYEFSGNASASYDGYVIPNSSLKGGSGMFELGYKIYTPTANAKRPVSIDLSLIGWFGKKEGIMPKLTARWYI